MYGKKKACCSMPKKASPKFKGRSAVDRRGIHGHDKGGKGGGFGGAMGGGKK